MDSISAFALGKANRGRELMVFDWDRAAVLIAEKNPNEVSAGLSGDWEWTGGLIYENGAPVPEDSTYVYLASTWAVPEIIIDGDLQSCFKMVSETPGWNEHTFWPESALSILANPERTKEEKSE